MGVTVQCSKRLPGHAEKLYTLLKTNALNCIFLSKMYSTIGIDAHSSYTSSTLAQKSGYSSNFKRLQNSFLASFFAHEVHHFFSSFQS